MIYIKNDSEKLFFPRVSNTEVIGLKVENQLTHWQKTFAVNDGELDSLVFEVGPTFYLVTNLKALIDALEVVGVGQYTYTIIGADDEVISQAIFQFNDYSTKPKQYKSEINIKQYNG